MSRDLAASIPARRIALRWGFALALLVLPTAGCKLFDKPSNCRDWSPDMAVLSRVEINDNLAHVHNIRDCTYLDADTYVVHHYDKTYNLDDLEGVDFIMVPFQGMSVLAHTMLSFAFRDGQHLAVSVEIRREQGEKYEFLQGSLNGYELMYVVGDERDLVKLRTNYRMDDVYLYPVRATPEQAREMFVDVMARVNKLAGEPEFYNTFTNNCTTNIVRHVNHIAPGKVRLYDVRVLFPGLSDKLAYNLGLLDTRVSFEETRRRANISETARRSADSPDFSAVIRR
jgi:hypothetical protein